MKKTLYCASAILVAVVATIIAAAESIDVMPSDSTGLALHFSPAPNTTDTNLVAINIGVSSDDPTYLSSDYLNMHLVIMSESNVVASLSYQWSATIRTTNWFMPSNTRINPTYMTNANVILETGDPKKPKIYRFRVKDWIDKRDNTQQSTATTTS